MIQHHAHVHANEDPMAASTAAEARSTIACLARDVLKLAAKRPAPALPGSIDELARLIRHADDGLERLRAHDDDPEVQELLTIAQAQRHLLYLLMADVNPEQAWFWTESWQAGERAADADFAAGRSTFYASDDEFRAALKARMQP
jgi:hypothetical protein